MNIGDLKRMLIQHPELPNSTEVVVDINGREFMEDVWPSYVWNANSIEPGKLVLTGYRYGGRWSSLEWYQIMASNGPIPSLPENDKPTIVEQIESARDLARTGLCPDILGYTDREWAQYKLDKIAGELTRIIDLVKTNYL